MGTTKYKDDFNHDEFWDWCRLMSMEHNKVYVSEYNAPDDFKCVWQKQVTNPMRRIKTYKLIEKLFTI